MNVFVIDHELTEQEKKDRSMHYDLVVIDTWSMWAASMSEATGIPAHMLTCDVAGGNERDIHKYIVTVNATLKGTKRRARRMRALINKMARKYGRPI